MSIPSQALASSANDYPLLQQLQLYGHKLAADVAAATRQLTIERTIDGASTLTLQVSDHRRTLVRSGVLDDYLWAEVDGLRYQLVQIGKTADTLNLQMEDTVVAALRRQKGSRKWPAASTSRAAIVRDMAAEVPVPVEVDPGVTGTVSAEVNRSKEGSDPTDSWSVSGSLGSDVGARRFSTGRALVFGGDQWLTTRYPVVRLAEPILRADGTITQGPLVTADFTVDYGQPNNSATLTVDADRWAVPVGQGVELSDLGPADGLWLVQRSTRTATRNRMSVELSRIAKLLPEPTEDAGDFSFLPGFGADTTGTAPTNVTPTGTTVRAADGTPRQVMVNTAKAQQGASYVWGASGPKTTGFDCSGLVQFATRVAGKPLGKPARSQWATVRASGTPMSVEDGLKTEGALLFRIGRGETDHVAISLGNGSTVEARGKAYGCGVFPGANGRDWTNAGLWV